MGLNFLELGWEVYTLESVLLKNIYYEALGMRNLSSIFAINIPLRFTQLVRKLHRLGT